jgi:hypothetical protein
MDAKNKLNISRNIFKVYSELDKRIAWVKVVREQIVDLRVSRTSAGK